MLVKCSDYCELFIPLALSYMTWCNQEIIETREVKLLLLRKFRDRVRNLLNYYHIHTYKSPSMDADTRNLI